MKITERQEKILQALAEITQEEVGTISLSAARGIMHFSIEDACNKWGIELSEAEEFEPEKRKRFFGDLVDFVRGRLARYHVPEGKIDQIVKKLFEEYGKY